MADEDKDDDFDADDLVLMSRDEEQYPEPHTAQVHVAEVENWFPGGWVIAEKRIEPEPGKQSGDEQKPGDDQKPENTQNLVIDQKPKDDKKLEVDPKTKSKVEKPAKNNPTEGTDADEKGTDANLPVGPAADASAAGGGGEEKPAEAQ